MYQIMLIFARSILRSPSMETKNIERSYTERYSKIEPDNLNKYSSILDKNQSMFAIFFHTYLYFCLKYSIFGKFLI